jgi:hypothetical protein
MINDVTYTSLEVRSVIFKGSSFCVKSLRDKRETWSSFSLIWTNTGTFLSNKLWYKTADLSNRNIQQAQNAVFLYFRVATGEKLWLRTLSNCIFLFSFASLHL